MRHKSTLFSALFDAPRIGLVMCFALSTIGCSVSSSHKHDCEKDDSISLNPIIGLFGMAVDEDDYEHFFDDDDKCKCKH